MTAYPSILKAAHLERGMRWMIFVSLCLHVCLIAVLLGKPPDRGKTIYFNPAYTVELIGTGGAPGMPGLPDTGGPEGASSPSPAGGAPVGRAEPLWKGPSGFTSQVKALRRRTHVPLQAETAPQASTAAAKKTTIRGRRRNGQAGSGSGQTAQAGQELDGAGKEQSAVGAAAEVSAVQATA